MRRGGVRGKGRKKLCYNLKKIILKKDSVNIQRKQRMWHICKHRRKAGMCLADKRRQSLPSEEWSNNTHQVKGPWARAGVCSWMRK